MNCERNSGDLPDPKSFSKRLEFRMKARPGFKKALVAESMSGSRQSLVAAREKGREVSSFASMQFEPVSSLV